MASTLSDKLQDPVCETTRKQRRSLLAFSALGIAIAKAKLFPTEITALGIKFAKGDSEGLIIILSGVIAYYLITFVVFSWSEFVALRVWRIENQERYKQDFETASLTADDYGMRISTLNLSGSITLQVRTIFEFLVPVIIAGISIVWLLVVDPSADDANSISNNPLLQENTEQDTRQGFSPKGFG